MSTRIEQAVPEQPARRYYSAADKATIETLYDGGYDDHKIGEVLDRSAKAIQCYRLNNAITWRHAAGVERAAERKIAKSIEQRCAQHLADLAKVHDHAWPAGPEGDGRFGAILRPLASFASHASLVGSPAGLCADDSSPGRSGRVGARGHQ